MQPSLKHNPKSEKCVFIGYPKETVGYTFYHKSEGKTFVARFGVFLEKEYHSGADLTLVYLRDLVVT